LQNAEAALRNGLSEWKALIAGNSDLETVAETLSFSLKTFASFSKDFYDASQKVNGQREEIVQSLQHRLNDLETLMETIIDPAKEARIQAADSAHERGRFFMLLGVFIAFVVGAATLV